MITRLDSSAKQLADKLRVSAPKEQRAAALIACTLALLAADVNDSRVAEVLKDLKSSGRHLEKTRVFLEQLISQLDEKYFSLLAKAEANPRIKIDYLRWFSQARAVSALAFAGYEDSLMAALEAIYEASVTVDDATEIYEAVLTSLQ